MGMNMVDAHGGQRTAFMSWIFPSATWILEIEPTSSDLTSPLYTC